MKKLQLLYVHGYLGHGNGPSSDKVKAALKNKNIIFSLQSPEFPVTEPAKMISLLADMQREGKYDYIIASSLGAFYAMQIPKVNKILINPAMPENLLQLKIQDPGNNPKITDELLTDLEKQKQDFFNNEISKDYISSTYIVFGNQDTIAGNEEFFERYCTLNEHIVHVDMEHRLDEKGAEVIADIIYLIENEK